MVQLNLIKLQAYNIFNKDMERLPQQTLCAKGIREMKTGHVLFTQNAFSVIRGVSQKKEVWWKNKLDKKKIEAHCKPTQMQNIDKRPLFHQSTDMHMNVFVNAEIIQIY